MKELTGWNKIKFKSEPQIYGTIQVHERISPFYVSEIILNFIIDRKVLKEFNQLDDFSASSLLLVSMVISADNQIQEAELARFYNLFSSFHPHSTRKNLDKLIKAFINKFCIQKINTDILRLVCFEIVKYVPHKKDRQNLIYLLFSVAIADRLITKSENSTLNFIARNLGFTDKDIRQLFAFFKGETLAIDFDHYYRWDYSQESNRNTRDKVKFTQRDEKSENKKTQSNKTIANLFSMNKLHICLELLGLSYNANNEEIKNKYKRLA